VTAIVPPVRSIRAFKTEASFQSWLKINHAKASELYLRIYKKDTGIASVTYAQALDVALCWGWIDGLKKSYDDKSFLQRFTPRKAKSQWSQINREHVKRLIAAGRMTPMGQKQIDAAKADGRWEAAYASSSNITVPGDLLAAIEAEPKALGTYRQLNRQNLYALAYRILHIKTAAGRAKRIEEFVAMLKRGESIYPNSSRSERTAASTRRISAQSGKKVQRAKATNIQKKVEKKRRKETQSA
jgi:uncharacterized protein YdeI (YjbR/CyaY-like superfamily)